MVDISEDVTAPTRVLNRDPTEQVAVIDPMAATAKGGTLLFVGTLISYASRFVIGFILARALGATLLGSYNLAMAAAEVAGGLALLGLQSALVRYLAMFRARRDDKRLWRALQIGLGLPAVMSLSLAALLFFFAEAIAARFLGDPGLAGGLQLASLAVPAMVLADQLNAALRGLGRIDYVVLVENLIRPQTRLALLLIILAATGLSVATAIGAFIVAAALTCLLLFAFLYREHGLRSSLDLSTTDARELLTYSLPIYLSTLAVLFGDVLRRVVLGAAASLASVGVFAVAIQINLVGTVFYKSVMTAAMPIMAALHDADDRVSLGLVYRSTTRWILTVNMPIFIVLSTQGRPILSLFGEEFIDGASALTVIAWANLASVGTGPCGALLDMAGFSRWKLVNALCLVTVSIVTSLLLIPPFGLIGAASSMLFANLVVNALAIAEVYVLVGLQPYDRGSLKPIAASITGAIASLGVATALGSGAEMVTLVVGVATGLAVYAVTLAALGVPDEDVAILRRFVRRIHHLANR